MWKNTVEPERPQIMSYAHALCMLAKATDTLRICNIDYIYTAKMFSRSACVLRYTYFVFLVIIRGKKYSMEQEHFC
jgi:hypothetical protein